MVKAKDAAITALERELTDAAKEIAVLQAALLKGAHTVAPFVPRVVGKDDGKYPWDRATFMCRLDHTVGEGKAVAEMFLLGRRTSKVHEVTRVDIIGCDGPHAAYAMKKRQLKALRAQKLKSEKLDFTIPDIAMKLEALERLASQYRTRDGGVKEFLAWVGVSASAVPEIVANGMTAVGETDPGFYGGGVYVAVQPEYACEYAVGIFSKAGPVAKGTECVVLLCWVVVGNVYPITRLTDYADPGDDSSYSKFYSPSMGSFAVKPGFTAHHAAVSAAYGFQVPGDVTRADYDEVVVPEGAQSTLCGSKRCDWWKKEGTVPI